MKKGLNMTAADARAHQERHGFGLEQFVAKGQAAQAAVEGIIGKKLQPYQVAMLGLRKREMNKTEAEFARILQSENRRGSLDVLDWKYEPFTIHWGKDEKTGRTMRYKPDFIARRFGDRGRHRVIEVKGGHIFSRDLVRFRGCRAEWQWLFDFELWQKKAGQWKRLE